jgi:hypothetical protein
MAAVKVEWVGRVVGRVIAYAAVRLVPAAGAALTAEAITFDYQQWCAGRVFSEMLLRVSSSTTNCTAAGSCGADSGTSRTQ